MTHDHRTRLKRSALLELLSTGVAATWSAGIGIAMAYVVGDFSGTGAWTCFGGLTIAMFFSVGAILLLMAVFRIRQPWRALDQSEVDVVTGLVHKWNRGRQRHLVSQFEVGGKQFRVSARAHAALVEGQSYRFHYLRGVNKILAVEPVALP